MSQHTKGPWKVRKGDKYYAVCSGHVPLAAVLPQYIKDEFAAEANARLMATAPQLLEALRKVLDHLDNCMIVTCDGYKINDTTLRESIVDALMKAEGYRT
jgi:hypothetical protein